MAAGGVFGGDFFEGSEFIKEIGDGAFLECGDEAPFVLSGGFEEWSGGIKGIGQEADGELGEVFFEIGRHTAERR